MASAPGYRVFMLGATGYVGSQFLIELSRSEKSKALYITALVRALTPEKESRLKKIHPAIQAIEGNLDDEDIIREEASKADIVIDCASSDHWPSVRATLAGLEKRSGQQPGNPPLYIHISGTSIVSDNCKGEDVEPVEHTDIGLNLEQLPPANPHLHCDIPIAHAGTRRENPVRTIIVFPGWIYGVGEGIQKVTVAYRIFLDLAKTTGYVGTWGKGHNGTNNIHVKDVAKAIRFLLEAALDGKVGGVGAGTDDLYFVSSNEKVVPNAEIMSRIGNTLYHEGLVGMPGSKPFPDEIVEPFGPRKLFFMHRTNHSDINQPVGWSALGGNVRTRSDKMAKLGWQPTETRKKSLN
ncbi:hypothetical protein VNI00_015391 [Paramarasmius palmivorus]|uniref:NAD-dependent epimerase/dehydratase domain-containing protein n=1 Tax=Paramarasmius palmivorus TaxID=297713 RepID=A0AAW0BKE7_9AGAR